MTVEDIECLVNHLQSNYWGDRAYAVVALGNIGDPRAVKPLITKLGDKDHEIRAYAVKALAKIGEPAVEQLIKHLGYPTEVIRSNATKALVKIGEPAVEHLIKHLGYPSGRVNAVYVVTEITKALIRIGDSRAIDPMIKKLDSHEPRIRMVVVEALKMAVENKFESERAIEGMIYALGDPFTPARNHAAEIFGEIVNEKNINMIKEKMKAYVMSESKKGKENETYAKQDVVMAHKIIAQKMKKQKQPMDGIFSSGLPKPPANTKGGLVRTMQRSTRC